MGRGVPAEPSLSVSRTYEPNRNLITKILNTSGTNIISRFDYENDAIGRRTKRVDVFAAESPSITNDFGYNVRSELIEALMGTNSHSYGYDPIGNRQLASLISGLTTNVSTYAANSLNQYSQISNQISQITPTYDADGNLTNYNGWSFSWDAENRLVLASNATTVVSNAYDYMSRRIGKSVYTNDSGSWILASGFSFTYDGWAMLREQSASGGIVTTNSYVYGLDLSGSIQGAGTIGGLLSMVQGSTSNVSFYAYDANGNVTDLVDTNGASVAHYEYDPYGNTSAMTGTAANSNPYRFSTKYIDGETGLYYYGYRQYSPELGRWLSRDPIEESGFINSFQPYEYAKCWNQAMLVMATVLEFDRIAVLFEEEGYEEYAAIFRSIANKLRVQIWQNPRAHRWHNLDNVSAGVEFRSKYSDIFRDALGRFNDINQVHAQVSDFALGAGLLLFINNRQINSVDYLGLSDPEYLKPLVDPSPADDYKKCLEESKKSEKAYCGLGAKIREKVCGMIKALGGECPPCKK